ncbi:MAG: hypothetical protein PQJ46_15710, partial [Spirochaetales bacterium]|nr:hypothetical protein [Spirochaetales bacterium]
LIRIVLLPILCSVEGLHSRLKDSEQLWNSLNPVSNIGMNELELSIPVCYSLFSFILFRKKKYKYQLNKRALTKEDTLIINLYRTKDGWQINYQLLNEKPEITKDLFLSWSDLYY